MVIDIHSIFDNEGESLDFEGEVSPGRLSEIKGYSFSCPVSVSGRVINRAGVVTMDYHIYGKAAVCCDRCLRSFEYELSFDCGYTVVRELAGGERNDYAVARDDKLDVDELAASDIVLQMPSKLLCREDCKGLCPKCGADLNVCDCGCISGS